MAENTNQAKCAQMWKEIYLFKFKKNVSISVHAREQVVKMNKMLFFILFSQSAVLRPSRLLLLSTRLSSVGEFRLFDRTHVYHLQF